MLLRHFLTISSYLRKAIHVAFRQVALKQEINSMQVIIYSPLFIPYHSRDFFIRSPFQQ